jgi:hypothetical protein
MPTGKVPRGVLLTHHFGPSGGCMYCARERDKGRDDEPCNGPAVLRDALLVAAARLKYFEPSNRVVELLPAILDCTIDPAEIGEVEALARAWK